MSNHPLVQYCTLKDVERILLHPNCDFGVHLALTIRHRSIRSSAFSSNTQKIMRCRNPADADGDPDPDPDLASRHGLASYHQSQMLADWRYCARIDKRSPEAWSLPHRPSLTSSIASWGVGNLRTALRCTLENSRTLGSPVFTIGVCFSLSVQSCNALKKH